MARLATMDDLTQNPSTTTTTTSTAPAASTTPAASAVPAPETFEEHMRKWDESHPDPTEETVETPQMNDNYSKKLDDIIGKYTPYETTKKQEKREQSKRRIAAISDGISAVANLIGTAHGAENVYDPKNSLYSAVETERQKRLAIDKGDRDKYYELIRLGAKGEMDDNQKKLTLYKAAKEAAARNYRDAVNNRARARKAEQDAFLAQEAGKRTEEHNKAQEKQAAENAKETARAHKENERTARRNAATAEARLAEEKRQHNKEKKKEASKRYVINCKYGYLSFDHGITRDQKVEMITKMQEAGVYGKKNVLNQISYKTGDVDVIFSQGAKTSKGFDIVRDYRNELE